MPLFLKENLLKKVLITFVYSLLALSVNFSSFAQTIMEASTIKSIPITDVRVTAGPFYHAPANQHNLFAQDGS